MLFDSLLEPYNQWARERLAINYPVQNYSDGDRFPCNLLKLA